LISKAYFHHRLFTFSEICYNPELLLGQVLGQERSTETHEMARTLNKLSARTVAAATAPGRYSDGGNLYLSIGNGGRRWVFMFRWQGKQCEMGLGSLISVPLARARDMAGEARLAVAKGINPLDARRKAKQAAKAVPTFGACADDFIESKSSQWRNETHKSQWTTTLTKHAAPLTSKLVNRIETEDVLDVLKPLWAVKPETASRLRGRIERVLDAAKAKGYRSGENPARWRGHLDHLLPTRQKLTRGHHAAMPYPDVPDFVAALRKRAATAALALEFLILTAARSGEVLGATWGEINLDDKLWTVPANRMKAGRIQRVPLVDRAIEILNEIAKLCKGDAPSAFVFPGSRDKEPLSNMSMTMLMRRMEREETVHGFRSSFRDWAGEITSFPREIAEAALAHIVGDATERAYRRGDALEKRRKLMSAWAIYCNKPSTDKTNVVPMSKKKVSW
jgi:integrase